MQLIRPTNESGPSSFIVSIINPLAPLPLNDFINAVEPLIDLQNQEYLSFSKAALLMGCTRQYIYKLVGQGRLRASRLSSRMSLIRRADIESLLAASPYERVLPVVRPIKNNSNSTKGKTSEADNSPMEYYTGEEVMATFKIGQGWLYTSAKRYRIRTCRIAGRIYYSKAGHHRHRHHDAENRRLHDGPAHPENGSTDTGSFSFRPFRSQRRGRRFRTRG